MHIFCLCVFRFFDLLVAFGCLLNSFSSTWADFEFLLGGLGQPLNHFGAPWAAKEVALVRLGTYRRLSTQQTGRLIPSKWLSRTMPAHKKWPSGTCPKSPAILAIYRNVPEMAQQPQLPTPLHSRPGPGRRELRTDSLKLIAC